MKNLLFEQELSMKTVLKQAIHFNYQEYDVT
jgi:hypothetical protein